MALLSVVVLLAASVAVLGLVPGYWTMIPIVILAGLGNAVFHPADFAILNASVHNSRLGRAYGAHGICGNLGWAAAPPFVWFLAELFGWRTALVAAGCIGLAATVYLAGQGDAMTDHRRPERGAAAPKTTLVVAVIIAAATIYPATRLGGEFMPPLDEGDLLYMPSALPGISIGKATEVLQQTDRLIKTVPEVARVFGKAGRAETATDPAPIEMIETTIEFKARSEWRAGMTPDKLVEELDRIVKVPGISNIWVPPIRNRIDMLATGIKSPVGVKIAGPDLAELDRAARGDRGADGDGAEEGVGARERERA